MLGIAYREGVLKYAFSADCDPERIRMAIRALHLPGGHTLRMSGLAAPPPVLVEEVQRLYRVLEVFNPTRDRYETFKGCSA